MDVPLSNPVTTPAVEMDAMVVAEDAHVPPGSLSLTVAVAPVQMFTDPDIGLGNGFNVSRRAL